MAMIQAPTKKMAIRMRKAEMSFAQIAKELRVSEASVRRWWNYYSNPRFIIVKHVDRQLRQTSGYCIVDTLKVEIVYWGPDHENCQEKIYDLL